MADTKKEAIYYGTGRRKNAIARVRLVPGTGKVTVNKRDAEDYFGRKALVEFATAPFTVTGTAKHFDVIATLNGGGISGSAYGRAQEVRSQEGPQASAVLQALSFERYICKKKARICGPSSCYLQLYLQQFQHRIDRIGYGSLYLGGQIYREVAWRDVLFLHAHAADVAIVAR